MGASADIQEDGEVRPSSSSSQHAENPPSSSSSESGQNDNNTEPDGSSNGSADDKTPVINSEKHLKEFEQAIQKVDVKWVDFDHFKNRYSSDEGLEIIEVLKGGPHIREQYQKEHACRLKGRAPNPSIPVPEETHDWIERIRIQSPLLCLLLWRLSSDDSSSPRSSYVYVRPFCYLYDSLSKLKECLDLLNERWATREDQDDDPQPITTDESRARYDDDRESVVSGPESSVGNRLTPLEAIEGPAAGSITTLRHLRKLVEFIEEHITPVWKRAAGTTQHMFRNVDLWMAFHTGELLYVPSSDVAAFTLRPMGSPEDSDSIKADLPGNQKIWRLYNKYVTQDDLSRAETCDCFEEATYTILHLYCYHIDHNGFTYGPIDLTFYILAYEGEKDIRTLPIYPLRFAKEPNEITSRFLTQGKMFEQAVKEKHLHYDGWTVVGSPNRGSTRDTNHDDNSEYIDSDVMVDLVEGYKTNSRLKAPELGFRIFDDGIWRSGFDEMSIKFWENSERKDLLFELRDYVIRLEIHTGSIQNKFLKENKFARTWRDTEKAFEPEDEDVILLPRCVPAYAFRERRFIMVDIESLSELPKTESIFRDLRIDVNHKRMVKSLVKEHFHKRDLRKLRPRGAPGQDLFRGKGSGLVVLLHGVPGVGKTATAEAVAQVNNKPLFAITCGDLGFSPKDVEISLRDIFRLANLWDCVLLLDEADVFLSRREVGDLQRNALVSGTYDLFFSLVLRILKLTKLLVFLRVLEYYPGILFLTTNRVGTLDEALRSRIHVSLYYPPLDEAQTLEIFKVNIRKLHDIEAEKCKSQETAGSENSDPILEIDDASILDYAQWYFDSHPPEERWNGRQIRNAFQVSYSLASIDSRRSRPDQWGTDDENDDEEDKDLSNEESRRGRGGLPVVRKLDWQQFDDVANTIEQFDDYLYNATHGSQTDNARQLGLRADDYNPADWEYQRRIYDPNRSPYRNYASGRPRVSRQPPSPGPSHKHSPRGHGGYSNPRPRYGDRLSDRRSNRDQEQPSPGARRVRKDGHSSDSGFRKSDSGYAGSGKSPRRLDPRSSTGGEGDYSEEERDDREVDEAYRGNYHRRRYR